MKQINKLLDSMDTKKLLIMFPHPDDETVMASGLILEAIGNNWEVEVICLTRGGAGQIHINGNGHSLKDIRVKEMGKAMSELGVEDYQVLDFPDGRLRDRNIWQRWLNNNIDWSVYGLIVTYDSTGVSGHPDHIAVSEYLLRKTRVIKGKKKPKLIWVSMMGKQKEAMVREELQDKMKRPDWVVIMSMSQVLRKWKALRAHESQALGKKWWVPNIVLLMIFRKEYFYEVKMNKKYSFEYVDYKI